MVSHDDDGGAGNNVVATKPTNLWARIVSGTLGSVVTSLVVTPLEVVKVRLQVNSAESSATAAAAETLLTRKGVVPCPRGCGTFVLYNGQMECVLPRSAVSWFDETGHLTQKAKESCSWFGKGSNNKIGTFSMIRRIFLTEGLTGIYAGLAPTLVMALPNTVLYYSANDEIVWRLRKYFPQTSSQSSSQDWIPFVAGGSARFMASIVTAPFEALRTRQASIVGREGSAPGMWQELRIIIQTEGAGALYRGVGPTLWRDVPFSAIYWVGVDRFRKAATAGESRLPPGEQICIDFVSGALSGAIAAACTTPFDVVKTRQQTVVQQQVSDIIQPITDSSCCHGGATVYEPPPAPRTSILSNSTFAHLRQIGETEGLAGLWRGNQVRMLRVVPGCAIMISTYELGKRVLS